MVELLPIFVALYGYARCLRLVQLLLDLGHVECMQLLLDLGAC
jgi:hypothetical protein